MEEDLFVLDGVVYEKPSPQQEVPNWIAKKFQTVAVGWATFLSRGTAVNILGQVERTKLDDGEVPTLENATFDVLVNFNLANKLDRRVLSKDIAVGYAFESVPCLYYIGKKKMLFGLS